MAQNWKHPAAELDIVSKTATHLVVTEVKTSWDHTCALESRFGPNARHRQRVAARELAQRFQRRARLDLIEVGLDQKSAMITVKRHQNL